MAMTSNTLRHPFEMPTVEGLRAAQREVPYLGPEPPPSRLVGRAAAVVALAGAALALVRAVCFAQLAGIDARLTAAADDRDLPGGGVSPAAAAALSRDLHAVSHRLHVIAGPRVVVLLGAFVLLAVWGWTRRPHTVLTARGETHVETPLRLVGPSWAAPLVGISMAIALGGMHFGRIDPGTPIGEFATHRWISAGSEIGFAALMVLSALRVRWSEQAHALRLQRSGPARLGLVPVEPVAPLVPTLPTSSLTDNSEGLGWILRTAALVMIVVAGLALVVTSIGEGASGGEPLGTLAARGAVGALLVGGSVMWRWRSHGRSGDAPRPQLSPQFPPPPPPPPLPPTR